MVSVRDGRSGSKVDKIGLKWDKSVAFSDQISVYLAPRILEPNLASLSDTPIALQHGVSGVRNGLILGQIGQNSTNL